MVAQWLLQVLAWDGLLPVVVWGGPWAVQVLAPAHRGLTEQLACLLPMGALFVRYVIGTRQVAANRCGPAMQQFQTMALGVGIFVLVVIDTMMILSLEMPPGALFATKTDLVVWGTLSSIYVVTMSIAMFPGRNTGSETSPGDVSPSPTSDHNPEPKA